VDALVGAPEIVEAIVSLRRQELPRDVAACALAPGGARFGSIIAVIATFAPLSVPVEGIQRELLAIANRLARTYGANYYEAVLYRAAAASRPLIEYCLRRA